MFVQGDNLKIFVTFVEKGCCAGQCQVWGQTDMDSCSRLERLVNAHRGITSRSVPDPSSIHTGDIVIAEYDDDNSWYRAQVLEILTGRLFVQFIDYGNKETVNLSKVIVASPELLNIPPLAVLFIVSGLTPRNGVSWTPSEQDVILQNLLNAEFNAEVVSAGTVGFPCAIKLTSASFLPTLLPVSNACWPLIKQSNELDVGKVYTIYVTHCESMLDFWVQDSSIQKTLDNFHAQIHAAVKGGTATCLDDAGRRPGAVCIARYRGSDQFYRAVLKEVNWYGACVVTYIDYGDSANVAPTDLWPLPDEFTSLALQALRCCVTAGSVSLSSSDFRCMFASGLPVTICVRSKTKLRYLVEILTNMKSVPKLSAGGMGQGEAVASLALPSLVPVTLPAPPQYQPLTLPSAAWLDVCISFVNDDGSFYCQLITNANLINEMMNALNKKSWPTFTGAIVSGMAAVVRDSSDGCVYRTQVTSLTGGYVHSRLVDFGAMVQCKTTELCTAAFVDFPAQSFFCRLHGAEDRPPATVAGLLKEYDSKKPLVLAVRRKTAAAYFVDLVDSAGGKFTHVVDKLATTAQVPTPADCALNVIETAYVSAIAGDGEFFVQLSNVDVDALEQFGARLNEYYSQNSVAGLSQPQCGDYCCCMYSEDESFYRAIIIKESAGKYLVCFIDYGNEEYKEKNDLFVLLPPFCSLPRQTVRCKLLAGSTGSSAKRDLLEEHILANTINLIVTAKHKDEGNLQEDIYDIRLPESKDNLPLLMKLTRSVMSSSIFPQRDGVVVTESRQKASPSVETSGYSRQVSNNGDKSHKSGDALSHVAQITTQTSNRFVQSSSGMAETNTPEKGHHAIDSSLRPRSTSRDDDQSSDQINSFVAEKITYGKWLGCVVTHVDDPETFYCQLEGDNNVELLESLMDRIEKYINSLPPGIGVLRTAALGQPVVAKYSVDGSWYRARVTGVLKASRKLEVHFVDFGNREVVESADVRDMPHALLSQLPSQAIECCLSGIANQSVAGWSPDDVDSFKEIVDDQLLEVLFTGETGVDGQQYVHLLKGQENVNRTFLRASRRLSANYTSPVVSANVIKRRGAGDSSTSIKRQLDMGEEGIGPHRKGALNEASSNGQIIKFNYQSYEPNAILKCYAAYVTSPSKFYCHLKNTTGELDTLMSQLNSDLTIHKGIVNLITSGQSVCAQYSEDERWYRAIVEQGRNHSGQVHVRFVDYGNEENVPLDFIKPLNAVHMKLPVQAIECTLDEVIAPVGLKWSSEACAEFEEMFGDEAVEVKVLSRDEGSRIHRVSIDSIINKLVSKKLAVHKKLSAQHVTTTQQRSVVEANPVVPRRPFSETAPRLPKTESACLYATTLREHKVLKTDTGFSVLVSYVVSPIEFYIQLSETSSELDNMMEQIDNDYNKLTNNDLKVEKPFIGQPCCARYSVDSAFYRGIITELDLPKRKVKVTFVDYGNNEWVADIDVKYLKSSFAVLPIQSLKCCLCDVGPVSGRWTSDSAAELEALTTDHELTAVFMSYVDGLYSVQLRNSHTKQDIRKALLAKKLVCDINTDNLDYPLMTVSVGSEYDVVLSWFTSPSDFYCQLLSNRSTIEKLSNDLNETYTKLRLNEMPLKPARCVKGKACVGFYEVDGCWYRSRVLSCDGGEASVLYVDYGNVEKIRLARVKDIDAKFLSAPALQAVHCKLRSSENVSWSPQQKVMFENVLASKPVKCRFVEQKGDTFVVEIFDSNCTNIYDYVMKGGSPKPVENASKPVTSVPSTKQTPKSQSISFKSANRLKPKDVVKVEVVHIDDSKSIIHCQVVGKQLDELTELMEKLGEVCESSQAPVDQLDVNEPCAALYNEDETWYRALVLNVRGNDVTVLFVDYGNRGSCSLKTVRKIDDRFVQLPIQRVECVLVGCSDVSALTEALLGNQFEASVIEVSAGTNIATVELTTDKGKPLRSEFPDLFPCASKSTTVKQINLPTTACPTEDSGCYVLTVISPTDFYLQLASSTEQLESLVDLLCTEYSKLGVEDQRLPSPVEVGNLCCAEYSVDGAWYRAVVEQVLDDTTCKVRFMDYGNSDTVEMSKLKCLVNSVVTVCPLSYRCALYGVSVPAAGWSDNDIKRFTDITELGEKVLTCRFLTKSEQYRVKLLDGDVDVGSLFGADYQVAASSKQTDVVSLPKIIPPTDSINVCITSTVSPTDFYLQPESCYDELSELAEQLTAEYDSLCVEERSLSTMKVGALCCARYSVDGAWYRAVVESIADDTVCVIFVDYGNKDSVSLSDSIKQLSTKYTNLPPFAYKCCLYGIESPPSGWADAEVEKFVSATMSEENPVLTCKFVEYEESSDRFMVALSQDSADVAKLFENFAVEDTKVIESKSAKLQEVQLVHADSPASFYLQFVSELDALDTMATVLEAYVVTAPNLKSEDIMIGKLCACQFVEDELWYRAVITAMQVDSGTVSVQFVDYGNRADDVAIETLKELNYGQAAMPYFATQCTLDGLPTSVESCRDENAGVELLEMYSEKTLLAEFKSTGQPRVVKLFDGESNILPSLLTHFGVDLQVLMSETEETSTNLSKTTAKYSKQVIVSGKHQVLVSHIETLYEIYLHLRKNSVDLEVLLDHLDEFYSNTATSSEKMEISIGQPVCVNHMNVWYRGLVISIADGSVMFSVRLVDYGKVITAKSEFIKPLDSQFLEPGPLALKCQLFDAVKITDSAIALDRLKSTITEKVLEGDLQCVDEQCHVILWDKNMNINSLLVGTAVEYSSGASPSNLVKYTSLDVGHRYQVLVSDATSPSHFSCQLESDQLQLELLMKNLKAYYSTNDTIESLCFQDLSVGMLCVVKYSVDGEWYRAKILSSISEHQVDVVSIDYGTQESLDICNIYRLKDRYISHPAMSFLCCLDSCNNNDGDTVSRFQQLVSRRAFLAEVMSLRESSDSSDKYSVKLLDMGVSVAEKLADAVLMKDVNVIVTSVTSPNDFWCRIDNKETELPLLMDRIADLCACGNNNEQFVDLTPGSVCVAKYSDGVWYRARIISKSVAVTTVDASNDEELCTKLVTAEPTADVPAAVEMKPTTDVPTVETESTVEVPADDASIDKAVDLRCGHVDSESCKPYISLPDTESDISLPDILASNEMPDSTDNLPCIENQVCDVASVLVQVLFIDYGNTARVPISDLLPLSPDYLILPPQAVHCSLTSVLPQVAAIVEGDALWDEASCNRFVELVTCRDDERALQLRPTRVVRAASGNIVELFGRLLDGDIDVGAELVNGGYAVNASLSVLSSTAPVEVSVKQRRSSPVLEYDRCNVFVSPLQETQVEATQCQSSLTAEGYENECEQEIHVEIQHVEQAPGENGEDISLIDNDVEKDYVAEDGEEINLVGIVDELDKQITVDGVAAHESESGAIPLVDNYVTNNIGKEEQDDVVQPTVGDEKKDVSVVDAEKDEDSEELTVGDEEKDVSVVDAENDEDSEELTVGDEEKDVSVVDAEKDEDSEELTVGDEEKDVSVVDAENDEDSEELTVGDEEKDVSVVDAENDEDSEELTVGDEEKDVSVVDAENDEYSEERDDDQEWKECAEEDEEEEKDEVAGSDGESGAADVEEKYEACNEQSAVVSATVEEEEDILSDTQCDRGDDQVGHLVCIKTVSGANDESYDKCFADGQELEFQEVSEAMHDSFMEMTEEICSSLGDLTDVTGDSQASEQQEGCESLDGCAEILSEPAGLAVQTSQQVDNKLVDSESVTDVANEKSPQLFENSAVVVTPSSESSNSTDVTATANAVELTY